MAFQSKFTFIGDLSFPREDSNVEFCRTMKGGKDGNTPMMALNFGVKAGNSIGYVELFGMKSDTIYTMDVNNEKTEISWEDRNDPETIKTVASYKKNRIDLGLEEDGRKEFITTYDAIRYLSKHLKQVEAAVKIRGNVEKEPYITKKGEERIIDRYVITDIYLASETDKPGLYIDMELYYDKGSVDEIKDENKTIVEGYIRQYLRNTANINKAIGEAGKDFFIPQRVVLSTNDENIYEVLSDELQLTNKKLHCMRWRCKLIAGAEEIEFDESQLTPKQKRMVDMGLATVQDYAPKGDIYGERINELRLHRPLFTGEFVDGVVESSFTIKELQAETIKFEKAESFEEVAKKAKAKKEDVPFELDDDDFDDDFED